MSSAEGSLRKFAVSPGVSSSLSAVLLVSALGLLAGCHREAPTELGPETAAAAPTPPPAPPATPSRITPEMVAAAGTIEGDDVRAVVAEIADDRYMGRSPGSPGDKMTRAYLEKELAKRGYEPGGEGGSWEQPVELVGVTAAAPAKWTFERGTERVALERDTDFVATSGVQAPRATVDGAEVVFVGYGIEAPEYDWDDFKGVDVSGKVLLMLNNDPDWDPALFAGTERLFYGRWVYKYESAGRHGAAAALIIHTTPSAGYPWHTVQASWGGQQFKLPAGDGAACAGRGLGHRGRRASIARPRGQARRADRAGEAARLQAGAARHHDVDRAAQHDCAHAVGERARRLARLGPRPRRRARDIQRTSRSSRRRAPPMRAKAAIESTTARATTPPGVGVVLAIGKARARRCLSGRGAR